MQLPLGYSIVDVQDILTPGAYLLDVVDVKGEPLGLTVAVSVGQLRNGHSSDDADDRGDDPGRLAPMLPTSGSETRLVLEANVRATQLAFQHNQKTLELGLRVAETLREGVQALAEAQADWIKSASGSRGFYRNMKHFPPSEDVAPANDRDDRDEPAPVTPDWVTMAIPAVGVIVQQGVTAVMEWMDRRKTSNSNAPASGMKLRDLFDWNSAAKRGQLSQSTTEAERPPTASPSAMQHFLAIQAALTPQESAIAQSVAMNFTPEERTAWMNELKQLSVEEAVAKIRTAIAATSKSSVA